MTMKRLKLPVSTRLPTVIMTTAHALFAKSIILPQQWRSWEAASSLKPGEITLANRGVILDEIPEFDRKVLEVLRQPIENKEIVISRANSQVRFPANFQLVAAMNPCPCGYYGDKSGRCRCRPEQIKRYQEKLSGPLLDRIDLHITVPALPCQ